MLAGKLRHRVNIQRLSETRDSHGGVSRSWTTLATVWASVEPLKGRELYEAQQVKPDVTVKMTIRYYDGLTTADRIQFGSTIYNIDAIVQPEMVKRELVLYCKEAK